MLMQVQKNPYPCRSLIIQMKGTYTTKLTFSKLKIFQLERQYVLISERLKAEKYKSHKTQR